LVRADKETALRIGELELELARGPQSLEKALELARLYQDAGEFPWSYDALRNAERRGGADPSWLVRLGLAYIGLGKNADGLRVIRRAKERCGAEGCPPHVEAKVNIFERMARVFVERSIDSRRHRSAAYKVIREILKPIQVDPKTLRPKAPAEPSAAGPRPDRPAAPPGDQGR
jgi:hypothetical protein